MPDKSFDTLKTFSTPSGRSGLLHELAALERAGLGRVSRLPVSIRIVLEEIGRAHV